LYVNVNNYRHQELLPILLAVIPAWIAKPFRMHPRLFALPANGFREVVVVRLMGVRAGEYSFASAKLCP
jgi:hypothetical protein